MPPKKIIFIRAQGPQYHYIATYLLVGRENMELDPTMRYPICIPLRNLIPTHLYGSWMLMGVVGWN